MKDEVNLSIWMRASFPITERDRILPTICGVGVNDADYEIRTKIDGKLIADPAYRKWTSMITRCHSPNKIYHHYEHVTVCQQWLSFMPFRAWFIANHQDGLYLDKDILTDNRQYSPYNCIFVPVWVNNLTGDYRGKNNNGLPVGVMRGGDKFLSSIWRHGRNVHLGTFSSVDDAKAAWIAAKLDILMDYKPDLDAIDIRLYPRLVSIIKRR